MVKIVKQDLNKNKQKYQEVERLLKEKLDMSVPISHVGSTAIPDMYGKNIIDILVGAKDTFEFEKIYKILVEIGYFPGTTSSSKIYQFFASRKEETVDGDIHIHLVISLTDRYKDFLVLKEYLLNNKDEVEAYSNHKKELIENGNIDRNEYKRIKSVYVSNLIEKAKKKANIN